MDTSLGRHFAAIPVPFREDLTIDEEAFRRVCNHMLLTPSIDGLVVNANAGEVDSLTLDELNKVTKIAAEEARRHETKTISGVVAFPASNEGAAACARDAQNSGADGLLLISPSGFSRGVDLVPDVMSRYVSSVASAVKIPVIYFVAGPVSGVNHTPEIVRRIVKTPNVIGIKDTMWTPQGFDANLKAVRSASDEVSVLSGNDNCLLQNFISGADGTLLVLHLVMAPAITQMFDAVNCGDLPTALAIHRRHEKLVELLFARPMLPMPARVKYVLELMGVISASYTRSPVPALEESEKKLLQQQFEILQLSSPLNS